MASPTIYKTHAVPTLDTPKGLAIDPNLERILISDYNNGKVVLCRLDGMEQVTTLTTYSGVTIKPDGSTYCDGFYYVCDSVNHTLVRIRAKDLSYQDHFGTAGDADSTNTKLDTPVDVAVDGQYVYVVDQGNNRIMKLNLSDLSYDSKTSSINGSLDTPYGIAYKKKGGEALFLADSIDGSGTDRIIKFKTDFTYIEQVQYSYSVGATIPSTRYLGFSDDFVYRADGAGTIYVMDSDGLTAITSYTDSASSLSKANGIAFHRDAMFIADGTNDRISVWRRYNPRDAFTQATPAKFGGEFFDNPMIIVDVDSVIAGATQESGTPNRWKEENTNNYGYGWTVEDDVSSTWTEES